MMSSRNQVKVSFSVGGRYHTTTDNVEIGRAGDDSMIGLKLDGISGLVRASIEFDATITAINAVESGEDQLPCIQVHYHIAGGFIVHSRNVEVVRADVATFLEPDLSRVDNLIVDSSFSEIELHSVQSIN